MKRQIKWSVILIAIISITCAFATINPKPFQVGEKYVGTFIWGTRHYILTDLTGNPIQLPQGWTEGEEYVCNEPIDLCTITVNENAIFFYDSFQGAYYFENNDVIEYSLGTFAIVN
ncbi:MAG: hypothetical protein J0I32_23300 [Sphingobacteriales bacterium]|nr:hypothetical protein [Sphingobacteriales bacterium]OJW01968.1 MAG: hypothetical protein BGO52_00350 [Sphingobacteriales bacterium 44-61]